MRMVVQRASRAAVLVDGRVVGRLPRPGLVALVGVTHGDTEAAAVKLADKLWRLRILDAAWAPGRRPSDQAGREPPDQGLGDREPGQGDRETPERGEREPGQGDREPGQGERETPERGDRRPSDQAGREPPDQGQGARGWSRGDVSASEIDAPLLVVSQFTLYADTRKGRRPSWSAAAAAAVASPLIDCLVARVRQLGATVETGSFGAMMALELVNQGPVTLILDA
jgi:D-Tyr-tRNAtyr deacylase